MTQDEIKKAKELSNKLKGLSNFASKKVIPKPVVEKKTKDLSFINKLEGFKKEKPVEFKSKIAIPIRETEPDTPEQIAQKLNTLDQIIEARVIKDLLTVDSVVQAIKNLKGNDRIDISNLRNGENLSRIAMNDMRWHGGGLTQVFHDATLTGDGTQTNPLSVVTTSSGINTINGDNTPNQFLVTGTAGSDFNIFDDGVGTHTFNLPVADATHTGKLSNTDWIIFNSKQNQLPNFTTTDVLFGDGTDIPATDTGFFEYDSTGKLLTVGKATSASCLATGIDTTGPINSDVEYDIACNFFATQDINTNNISIGWNSASVAAGSSNFVAGISAGTSIVSSIGCVIIGHGAGQSLTTGSYNVFIGHNAGLNSTNQDGLMFIGEGAGQNNTGINNMFFGNDAGNNNTTGNRNLFIGSNHANTTGINNTFLGIGAGLNSNASDGTFVGQSAGMNVTSGVRNTLFGSDVGLGLTTGQDNVMIGSAIAPSANVSSTVIVGTFAGSFISTGSGNTLLGFGTNVTAGTEINSIALGYQAAIDKSNQIVFGSFGFDEVPNWKVRNIDWVMPAAQGGVNTQLTNDGFGNLSWAAASAAAITSINGDTTAAQTLTTGTTGLDFAIVDNGIGDHKFNLPDASATARGVVNTGTQTFGGNKLFANRMETNKGANVVAAGNLTLGGDGNIFIITGNTTINDIETTGWQAGSQIVLIFTGTPTITHNTGLVPVGFAKIFLAASVDLSAANNTILSLVYSGTNWYEKSRTVA